MAIETLAAGDSTEIVGINDVFDRVLEILDGDEGFLLDTRRGAPQSGDRLTPGKSFKLSPRIGRREVLHARNEDLTYQSIIQDNVTGGEENRMFGEDVGGTEVSRRLARRLNYSPGVNTDILVNDVTPPETGTLQVKVSLNAGAVFSVEEDIGGTVISQAYNSGSSLAAGAGYSFTTPCRGDATYNFQVDTGVQVNMLQIDYTREVVA